MSSSLSSQQWKKGVNAQGAVAAAVTVTVATVGLEAAVAVAEAEAEAVVSELRTVNLKGELEQLYLIGSTIYTGSHGICHQFIKQKMKEKSVNSICLQI